MGIGVKLQRLRTEDFIWVIYFFIALAALISDSYERDYVLTNNQNDKRKFKTINIIILTVAFCIYIYFVLINYEDVKELKREATKKEVALKHLGLVAALLFLSAGVISLYVELNKEEGLENIELF
ncbi:MAG: hypothetical protein NC483_01710 [Ruminococcus sp.]|nr:hypothetical protein [Ruminococcus sp.]